jgi:hypothetical protein
MLRWSARPLTATVALLAACAHAPARPVTPSARAPAPIVVEPVPVAAPMTWAMAATLPATRYLVEVSATLERDSAGRVLQQHVASRGIVTLQGRRDSLGGLRASGVVDSFTVRGLESVLSPPAVDTRSSRTLPILPPAVISVPFDANLDARMLRVVTRPPLANECDAPETGATGLVRDLLVRVPRHVAVGSAWRDSTVGFLCRLSVPITSRTQTDYVVERAEQVANRTELVVRRTIDTQLNGILKSTWRNVMLTGVGRTTQTLHVDAQTGLVRGIDGDGLLTVRLTDSSRRDASGTQEIRQKTTGRTMMLARP